MRHRGERRLEFRGPLDTEDRIAHREPRLFEPRQFRAGEPLRVLAAEPAPGTDAPPGTVLDDALRVAAGEGTALRLTHIQRAGRAAMDAAAFLRGTPVPAGTRLG